MPNPATDQCVLALSADLPSEALVKVRDVQGREISQHTFILTKGENSLTIPLGHLVSGIYLLDIQANGNQAVAKVVVDHE